MAKQFKRANRALRTIRTYLGRVIRDIGRKIRGEKASRRFFAHELTLARRVREQGQHQRGRKVYSLHAPEVECNPRKEKPIAPTSSGSRCRSPPRSIAPRVVSSSPMPRRCPATPTTVTRSPP